jgi:hypothetical protein
MISRLFTKPVDEAQLFADLDEVTAIAQRAAMSHADAYALLRMWGPSAPEETRSALLNRFLRTVTRGGADD